jgi:diaminohydroxyphosphoribosylaminopyrimidine deaminase/5-amino-6-(5-phosphoribosylamino)uracil reductase
VEILVAPDIESALRELGRREVTSLFLEGGRTLASAFASADLIDESRTFVAPMLLGVGEKGQVRGSCHGERTPVLYKQTARGGPLPAPPARVTALQATSEQVGEDTLVRAVFKEW